MLVLFFSESFFLNRNNVNLGMDVRVVLRCILGKQNEICRVGPVMLSCEDDNEPLNYIKDMGSVD
jgi:hypothetical protein